jgi:hypothetical protein
MTNTKRPHAGEKPGLPAPTPRRRHIDPILQEVYDIKAKLNAEAGYSVQKILERARKNSALRSAKP